jgi:hypothetical protein
MKALEEKDNDNEIQQDSPIFTLPVEMVHYAGQFMDRRLIARTRLTCRFFRDALKSLDKPPRIEQISCDVGRILILLSDGKVLAFEPNSQRELAIDINRLREVRADISRPRYLKMEGIKVSQVVAYSNQYFFLAEEGSVFYCAPKRDEQLHWIKPIAIPELSGIIQIFAANGSILFLNKEGEIFRYQEGAFVVKIPSVKEVKQIANVWLNDKPALLYKEGTVKIFDVKNYEIFTLDLTHIKKIMSSEESILLQKTNGSTLMYQFKFRELLNPNQFKGQKLISNFKEATDDFKNVC